MPASVRPLPPAPVPPARESEVRAKPLGGPIVMPPRQSRRRYPKLRAGDVEGARVFELALRRRGASRAEVAEDLDVSPNLVSRWIEAESPLPGGLECVLQDKRLANLLLAEKFAAVNGDPALAALVLAIVNGRHR